MTQHRVLVTGSSGAVGKRICRALLERGHLVRGLDLTANPELSDQLAGSITDADLIHQAMDGVDSVIHLAATPDEADFLTQLLPNNIVGVYHILREAKQRNLRRVVLASSIQTVNGMHWHEGLVKVTDAAPRNHYGVTKLFAENLGQMYALRYKLSVLAVRIGWFPRNTHSLNEMRHGGSAVFLSHRDGGRFFVRAIEQPELTFGVAYAISGSDQPARCDMEPSQRLIGFEPFDRYPAGVDFDGPIRYFPEAPAPV